MCACHRKKRAKYQCIRIERTSFILMRYKFSPISMAAIQAIYFGLSTVYLRYTYIFRGNMRIVSTNLESSRYQIKVLNKIFISCSRIICNIVLRILYKTEVYRITYYIRETYKEYSRELHFYTPLHSSTTKF